ncbi:MAG: tetratricopeptide repeat protein, partial [Polyangiales bacterium]
MQTQIVEDFRPMCTSLEWKLSGRYWDKAGVLAFAEDKVPYLINNSGSLSAHAAKLLFTACEATQQSDEFSVVELGAGCGLFARLFMDAFRTLCEEQARDYYD